MISITNTALALDALVPDQGPLWLAVAERLPPDLWLLQGEAIDPELVFWDLFFQPPVLLAIHTAEELPPRTRLSLQLYQAQLLVESMASSRAFDEWSLSELLSKDDRLGNMLRQRLQSLTKKITPKSHESVLDPLLIALSLFGLRYAAWDWFEEQAGEPAIAKRRGERKGEPLPAELGLFDKDGRMLSRQRRENWENLRAWLQDADKILQFTFQGKLAAADEKLLRNDLTQLETCSWSPLSALDALLADWPEDEPERPCGLKAAEAPLIAAIDQFLLQ